MVNFPGAWLVGEVDVRFGEGVWSGFGGKQRLYTCPINGSKFPLANRRLAGQLAENSSRDEMEVGRGDGAEEWLGETLVLGEVVVRFGEEGVWGESAGSRGFIPGMNGSKLF